jgi:hypothetical protein
MRMALRDPLATMALLRKRSRACRSSKFEPHLKQETA